MSLVIYLLLLFLAVLGLSDIIHSIVLRFYYSKKNKGKVMCCILKGEIADIQLRYVIEQYNWMGEKYADKIIAVDCVNDLTVANRCRDIANAYDIPYIKPYELNNVIDMEH